jgi:hypothetical protein
VVFGLKRPTMSVKNSFFARPPAMLPSPPIFSIIGSGKGVKMFSQRHYCRFSNQRPPLYFFLKVKPELASYLLAQGTFKKSM